MIRGTRRRGCAVLSRWFCGHLATWGCRRMSVSDFIRQLRRPQMFHFLLLESEVYRRQQQPLTDRSRHTEIEKWKLLSGWSEFHDASGCPCFYSVWAQLCSGVRPHPTGSSTSASHTVTLHTEKNASQRTKYHKNEKWYNSWSIYRILQITNHIVAQHKEKS